MISVCLEPREDVSFTPAEMLGAKPKGIFLGLLGQPAFRPVQSSKYQFYRVDFTEDVIS